jgi:hypothetical protein
VSIADLLEQMAGQRIPGGCDDCDAYQEMTKQDGIYVLTVHHDDTCPTWQQIRARRKAQR